MRRTSASTIWNPRRMCMFIFLATVMGHAVLLIALHRGVLLSAHPLTFGPQHQSVAGQSSASVLHFALRRADTAVDGFSGTVSIDTQTQDSPGMDRHVLGAGVHPRAPPVDVSVPSNSIYHAETSPLDDAAGAMPQSARESTGQQQGTMSSEPPQGMCSAGFVPLRTPIRNIGGLSLSASPGARSSAWRSAEGGALELGGEGEQSTNTNTNSNANTDTESDTESIAAVESGGGDVGGNVGGWACVPCPRDHFSLPSLPTCMPLLGCGEITANVRRGNVLNNNGSVKTVFTAYLRDEDGLEHPIALLTSKVHNGAPTAPVMRQSIERLRELCPSVHVTQIVGYCVEYGANGTVSNVSIVTELAARGSALGFLGALLRLAPQSAPDVRVNGLVVARIRRALAVEYVRAIAFLHGVSTGPYIMCDGKDPRRMLKQFLVFRVGMQWRIKVCDVDRLVRVSDTAPVKRGMCHLPRVFNETFTSPEERRPRYSPPPEPPADGGPWLHTAFNEKSDVWKIPNVVSLILGSNSALTNGTVSLLSSDQLQKLRALAALCKEINSVRRPKSSDLVVAYSALLRIRLARDHHGRLRPYN